MNCTEMLLRRKVNRILSRHFKVFLRKVCLSSAQRQNVKSAHRIHDVDQIRNIGILAHIDAGKTTTTERMLFYSGRIRNMGEVHHGNTVTDYMAQERDRGITITSAAVTFAWNKHRINLIDTPGHIDFTMEVEQALNVMDGAIIILDSSAGVEAQTLTVWRQADRYNIPRLVYCNKMDRSDGSLSQCLQSLQSKLSVCPLPIQLPIKDNGKLTGIVDLLHLEKCLWSGDRGEVLKREPLTEDSSLWHEAKHAREKLIDTLSDLDNGLAETVIALESFDNVSHQHLAEALRRVCTVQKGVPVLCGSSYKNIGVQLLMDAVTYFLPSPEQCKQHKIFSVFKGNLAAKAFKVINDKQRGPVVFFRVYSGKLSKGSKIYNIKQNKLEQIGKVMIVEADDFEEVSEVTEGNIAAVTGLKVTVTGDIISNSVSAFNAAKEVHSQKYGTSSDEQNEAFGLSVEIPDPVFFCSIEPPSQAYQSELDVALEQLQREDPSLRVSQNEETGQTILAGMGELHIDVIKERIRSEYKIDAELGPLQISYKETLLNKVSESHSISHQIGSGKHNVKVVLSLLPGKKKELLTLDKSKDNAANTAAVTPQQMKAIKRGLLAGLGHGPILGAPVEDVHIMLHWLEVGRGTSDTIISAGVSQCLKKMMSEGNPVLLEPVMTLEVVTDENYLSAVLADLSRRRTTIKRIDARGTHKVVTAETPLSEMLGYARDLRTLSSGTANFTMEFASFQQMTPFDQEKAIKAVTGF